MAGSIEEFDKTIAELEAQIEKLERVTREQGVDKSAEIAQLKAEVPHLIQERYGNLTPWDTVQLARNQKRPFTLDFVRLMFSDWTELHGDRRFGDDGAMIGGIARLDDDLWVTVIGQQKGRDATERHKRNFGYCKPEGYRKALRLMQLAEKFGRPIVCIVDTPAADPSVPSEERGISAAIAQNIHDMFLIRVPIIVVITGEGGSGGALGIAIGDRVLMLEHAIYSVIPPEGCAAILWRDKDRGSDAAKELRLTARHAQEFGVVDEIVPEPMGAAHRDFDATGKALREALLRHLREVQALTEEERLQARYQKFRKLGPYQELHPNGNS